MCVLKVNGPAHYTWWGNKTVWRPCGDFRLLNARTVHDRFPVRNIHDFASELDGKTVFSVIDCKKAYHHIAVNPEDVEKTAVVTPFGLFEFKYMTFILRNAAQTFKRFMGDAVKGCFSILGRRFSWRITSVEEHLSHFRHLFEVYKEKWLVITIEKCRGKLKLNFWRFVTGSGIRPLRHKVQAILDHKKPKEVQDLRRFLGAVNFYRNFRNRTTPTTNDWPLQKAGSH